MSDINDILPDEILLMIFQWIPGYHVCIVLPRVCVRWARLSLSYSLHLSTMKELKRLHCNPKSLLITVGLPRPSPLIHCLRTLASNLRELSIHSELTLHDDEFLALSALPNLRHLDIFTCSQIFGAYLLHVAKRLCSFVINETVGKGFLRGLATAPRLYALNMYGNSLYYPKSDMFFFLKASANRLTELTIRCNELTDEIYELISTCVNMKTLQLYSCWLLTKRGALALMRLSQLRCLHITAARMVRQEALHKVIGEMPQSINELVLSGTAFSDEHVMCLSERLPGLLVLEICQSDATTDGLANLVSLLPNLKQFDTDVKFEASHKAALLTHPTLKIVRCLLDNNTEIEDGNVKFMPGDGKYFFTVIRGDGQGYRADIFYYWSRRLPLEIIPNYNEGGQDLFTWNAKAVQFPTL